MSAEAICILVKSVSCHTLLVSASSLHHVLPRIRQILEQDHYPITMLELPALSELYPQMGLQSTNTVFTPLPLPSPSLYPEGAVILLHTSGSTGFPKAVRWTQKFVSTYRFTREPLNVLFGCKMLTLHVQSQLPLKICVALALSCSV
jgi:acyl-CoA synthetase (AMP-forming)/AMP-acid ligase II